MSASLLQIMKSDEDVRMISAEAPVLFARVCPRTLALLHGYSDHW